MSLMECPLLDSLQAAGSAFPLNLQEEGWRTQPLKGPVDPTMPNLPKGLGNLGPGDPPGAGSLPEGVCEQERRRHSGLRGGW